MSLPPHAPPSSEDYGPVLGVRGTPTGEETRGWDRMASRTSPDSAQSRTAAGPIMTSRICPRSRRTARVRRLLVSIRAGLCHSVSVSFRRHAQASRPPAPTAPPTHLVLVTIEEGVRALAVRALGAYAESLGHRTTLLMILRHYDAEDRHQLSAKCRIMS